MQFSVRAAALLVAGVLGLARSAGAVEFTTTWLTADGSQELRCRVANVGSKPATVLVELVDSSGANVATTTFAGCDGAAPLAANGFCSAVVLGGASAYCRVTSSSKKIRAALSIEDGSADLIVVPATR